MATFRTEHESKKWDAISSTVSQPLEHMLAGKATPEDLGKIGAALRKYDDLAAKLFESGIESAEATADAVIDKLNAERVALGKAPISAKAHDRLFKSTFQKVMAASTEDIIGSITDHFDSELAEVKQDLGDKVADAFAKVRSMMVNQQGGASGQPHPAPANVPAQHVQAWNLANAGHPIVPAAPNVAASQPVAQAPQPATPTAPAAPVVPPPSTATNNPIMNLLGALGLGGTGSATTQGPGDPANPGAGGPSAQSQTMIQKIKSLFGAGDEEAPAVQAPSYKNVNELMAAKGVRKDTDVIAAIEALNRDQPSLQTQTSIADQIKTALKANTDLRNSAMSEWDKIQQDKGKDDEGGWLRKIQRAMGFAGKGAKKGKGKGMDLAGKIVTPLLLALTAPQLIASMADGVAKYMNFDTISKFMTGMWDDLVDGTGKAIDWVIQKVKGWFGFGGNKEKDSDEAIKKAAKPIKPIKPSFDPGPSQSQSEDQVPRLEKSLTFLRSRLTDAQQREATAKTTGAPVDTQTKSDLTNLPNQIKQTEADLAYFKKVKPQVAGQQAPGSQADPTTTVSTGTGAPAPQGGPAGSSGPVAASSMVGGSPQTAGSAAAGGAAKTATGGAGAGAAGLGKAAGLVGGMDAATPQGTPQAAPTDSQSTTAVSPSSLMQASSVTAPLAKPSTATTKVDSATIPVFKNGMIIDTPVADQKAAPANKGGGAAMGNSISLGSFGMKSDDNMLNLLNMGVI